MMFLALQDLLIDFVVIAVTLVVVGITTDMGGENLFTPDPDAVVEDVFIAMRAHRFESIPDDFREEEKGVVTEDLLREIEDQWESDGGTIDLVSVPDVHEFGDSAVAIARLETASTIVITAVDLVRENHLWKFRSIETLRRISFGDNTDRKMVSE